MTFITAVARLFFLQPCQPCLHTILFTSVEVCLFTLHLDHKRIFQPFDRLRTWRLGCQGAFLKGPSGAGCTMGMYCLARVLESRTCSHPTRLFSSCNVTEVRSPVPYVSQWSSIKYVHAMKGRAGGRPKSRIRIKAN